jgi:hypothetical protein
LGLQGGHGAWREKESTTKQGTNQIKSAITVFITFFDTRVPAQTLDNHGKRDAIKKEERRRRAKNRYGCRM